MGRWVGSIRTKAVVFALSIFALVVPIALLGLQAMNRIAASATAVYADAIPVNKCISRAEGALLRGELVSSQAMLSVVHPQDFDEVQTVSTEDAVAMARRAAREDGIFSGPSTGANLTVALRLAARLGAGARVATIQVDSGLKYLGGSTYR